MDSQHKRKEKMNQRLAKKRTRRAKQIQQQREAGAADEVLEEKSEVLEEKSIVACPVVAIEQQHAAQNYAGVVKEWNVSITAVAKGMFVDLRQSTTRQPPEEKCSMNCPRKCFLQLLHFRSIKEFLHLYRLSCQVLEVVQKQNHLYLI